MPTRPSCAPWSGAAKVNDVTQAGRLVHGQETDVFADAGYQDVAKREEVRGIKA